MGSGFIPEENFRDTEEFREFAESHPILVREFEISGNNPLKQGLLDLIEYNVDYRKSFMENSDERKSIVDNCDLNDFYNFIFNLFPEKLVQIIETDLNLRYDSGAITLPFANYPYISWVSVYSSEERFFPVYLFKGKLGVYLALGISSDYVFSKREYKSKDLRRMKVYRNTFENLFLKYYEENQRSLGVKIENFFDTIDLDIKDYTGDEKKRYTKRAKGYEAGVIFSKYYDKDKIPNEKKLKKDFLDMVKIYEFAKKHRIFEKVESILYSDQDFYSIDTETYDFIDRNSDRLNELYYGVPGCGKSNHIKKHILKDEDESHIERVLFHPDYTYSDFIGQILPQVIGGEVRYEFVPGPFTSILKKAYSDPETNYYLVIEEINRGNAPAIFGDVFQLLDRKTIIEPQTQEESMPGQEPQEPRIEENDRSDIEAEQEEFTEETQNGETQVNKTFPLGTSEYGINNQNIASIVFGKENKNHMVRIPSNLSIIASMNTSDQNVFTLDTAFQRRWGMKLIKNSFDNASETFKTIKISTSNLKWIDFCERINEIILENNALNLSSEDKRLGVYFVNKDEIQDREKFSEKVLKYLWDDAFKFNRDKIFKSKYKSLEDVITDFNKDNVFLGVFKDGLFDTVIEIETENNPEQQNE